MKEKYLINIFNSYEYDNGVASKLLTLWNSNPCGEIILHKPDISFIKKKVPRFNILKDSIPLIVTLPSGIDVEMMIEMDYFKKNLYDSLRVPKEYLFETLTYDEFH